MAYSEVRNGDSSTLLYILLDCLVDRLRPIAKEMLDVTDLLFKKLGEEGFHVEVGDLYIVSRVRRLITALIQHIEHTQFVLHHAANEYVAPRASLALSRSLSLSLAGVDSPPPFRSLPHEHKPPSIAGSRRPSVPSLPSPCVVLLLSLSLLPGGW